MSTTPPSQIADIINLPTQLDQPVSVVAAPGVSDTHFRQIPQLFISFAILFLAINLPNSYLIGHLLCGFYKFFMIF